MGPPAAAVAALERAITLRPDAGHEKFMYLGQVLGGEAGLAALRRGVALLEAERRARRPRATRSVRRRPRRPAAGLCAVAEALLAEAGPDEGGPEVEALFSRAASLDPASPEPWQGLASLRVEQGRAEEGRAALGAATAKWLPNLRAMMAALRAEQGSISSDEEEEEGGGGGRGAVVGGPRRPPPEPRPRSPRSRRAAGVVVRPLPPPPTPPTPTHPPPTTPPSCPPLKSG